MEAIKFIKERDRMCRTYDDCKGCPLEADDDCTDFPNGSPERAVEIVEKWSEENPVKTRQSEFLKLHPNATLDSNGCLMITPCVLNKELYKGNRENCKYKGYLSDNNKYKGYLPCNNKKYWSEEI